LKKEEKLKNGMIQSKNPKKNP